MKFVDVELKFFEEIRFDMERWGLSPETVAMIGLRVQSQPYIGDPCDKGGFVFYWKDWRWEDTYRVHYRRLEERAGTEVAIIAIDRVDTVPKGQRMIEVTQSELAARLKSAAFDAAVAAAKKVLSGGAG